MRLLLKMEILPDIELWQIYGTIQSAVNVFFFVLCVRSILCSTLNSSVTTVLDVDWHCVFGAGPTDCRPDLLSKHLKSSDSAAQIA